MRGLVQAKHQVQLITQAHLPARQGDKKEIESVKATATHKFATPPGDVV